MEQRGINNRTLSERLGLTEVHISRLKHGNIKAIRLDTLYALCDTLDCEPGDILKKDES
ncbi:MAG: helix-turn-helix domain-containing protein [Eggerthellaceae bacterium]